MFKILKNIIEDHIDWRHQIFKLAKADIIKTYSGAALGWAWALVKPTITILVFWFAFSVGLRKSAEVAGYPFIIWMIVGMVPWFFMSEMLTQGAGSIRKYSYLVTKMKFPVGTIPTFVCFSKLAINCGLFVILLILISISGYRPDIYLLQLPIYAVFMVLFFIAWGLFSGMLSAMSKDFLNLVNALTTAIFWLSGILWDVNTIKSPLLRLILHCNPITYFATGYRNVFIYKKWIWEESTSFFVVLALFAILIAAGIWSYKKLIKEIPDVL